MKKILFSLLVVGLSLGFASCSSSGDDDHSSSAIIVGRWQSIERKTNTANATWEPYDDYVVEYKNGGICFLGLNNLAYVYSYFVSANKIFVFNSFEEKDRIWTKFVNTNIITKMETNFLEYTMYDDSSYVSYRFKRIY